MKRFHLKLSIRTSLSTYRLAFHRKGLELACDSLTLMEPLLLVRTARFVYGFPILGTEKQMGQFPKCFFTRLHANTLLGD